MCEAYLFNWLQSRNDVMSPIYLSVEDLWDAVEGLAQIDIRFFEFEEGMVQ